MKRTALILLTLALLCCGCSLKHREASEALFAMDTYCTVEAHGGRADEAVAAACAELKRLDAAFSIGDTASELSRINAAPGTSVTLSGDAAALISAALSVSGETAGAFDITVEPVVRLWGFYDEAQHVPARTDLDAALRRVGYDRIGLDGMTLHTDAGQALDFGAIAKGYAADRMVALMAEYGVKGALISLGGNVHALGTRPDGEKWRVGVRDPLNEQAVIGVVAVSDAAVVTAGSYQRYFEQDGVRYHHIIDPATGRPAESGLVSVTVIAASGARADALSTALFVMGRERALELWRRARDFDLILVTDAGEIVCTDRALFTVSDADRDASYIVE